MNKLLNLLRFDRANQCTIIDFMKFFKTANETDFLFPLFNEIGAFKM